MLLSVLIYHLPSTSISVTFNILNIVNKDLCSQWFYQRSLLQRVIWILWLQQCQRKTEYLFHHKETNILQSSIFCLEMTTGLTATTTTTQTIETMRVTTTELIGKYYSFLHSFETWTIDLWSLIIDPTTIRVVTTTRMSSERCERFLSCKFCVLPL